MTDESTGHIVGLKVTQLFGLYDYAIGSYGTGQPLEPGLFVLYGDNGSGKTTLLQLLYHTLSKEQKRGHRTALGRIPMRQFCVKLSDGTEVRIARNGETIRGAYSIVVQRPNQEPVSCTALIDSEGHANPAPDAESQGRWGAVMASLANLKVALYYLSDNRRSEQEPRPQDQIDIDLADYDVVFTHEAGELVSHRRVRPRKHVLESAISDLADILRHEAISAANIGEANINTIYSVIAKRVISAKGQQVAASQAQVRELVNTLQLLMEQSKPFSALGLMPELDLNELIGLTNQAKTTTKRMLATVLQPYVESVSARLDALRPTQQLIDTLVGTLNRFYTQKRVRFDLRRGLRILQHDKTALPPQALSSGEQQLLLLFCNTVRARSQATIFVIDEPELSLNVKWQRRLLEALLGLVAGTNVQFAIATHSVELLTTHRSAVVRLSNHGSGATE